MSKIASVVVFIVSIAIFAVYVSMAHPLDQFTAKEVVLSSAERTEAIKLAERGNDINLRRQQVQLDYQAKMDRLQEEENQLNADRNQMCFRIKRDHNLDPQANYTLYEWKGLLVRQ